ncbi:winged helix-turn-helix transcriptional regulator [Nonomuraea sp. RK-328]|nr:winged helix-turn-helix transcriptional regulator [Nonomuraea sp. RK-328]
MAITWVLKPEDVARIRFAFSPLWELVASLRTLRDPARQSVHLPWVKCVRPRLADLDMEELFALVPPDGYLVDFITPPPDTPLPDFASEIEVVRRTRPERAAAEAAQVVGSDQAVIERFRADPAAGVARVADALEAYWETCLAEFWPRVYALLERDVLRRSRLLAKGGARELFAGLDPAVSWTGERLVIERPWACNPYDTIGPLHGDGLLLVPSAFFWPATAIMSEPYQSMLVYPVSGVGTLWEQGPPPAPGALAALIGRSRARILLALAEPATTSALADRMTISRGAVSQHLGVLSDSGLTVGLRVGKEVVYRRTPTGDALALHTS